MQAEKNLAGIGSGGGWFIPARTLLDARLFHSPPNVAPKRKRRAAAAAAEIEVAAPAESSRECSRNCSTPEKTDENKRICKDFKADVPDYKFSNEPLAEGAPGWSEGWCDGGGRGGGGSAGRSDSKNLMGRTNAEFWAKAVRFERL